MDNEKYHYEQYAEEQYERTAEGFEEETFVEWRKRRQAQSERFRRLREERGNAA